MSNNSLSEAVVLAKTGAKTLLDVRHLHCWGEEFGDISIVARMANVEVLSLSANKISHLQPMRACLKLKELYLRHNQIASVAELQWLRKLPELRSLWLSDNPVTALPNYRLQVIALLPQLQILDNLVVGAAERSAIPPSSRPVQKSPPTQTGLPTNPACRNCQHHDPHESHLKQHVEQQPPPRSSASPAAPATPPVSPKVSVVGPSVERPSANNGSPTKTAPSAPLQAVLVLLPLLSKNEQLHVLHALQRQQPQQ
ncbi:leucine Rich Repeat family protein [Capsaspora owczarzaki ATCC 30864]|uniref:Leucine Rich Repeat family protein n=1 Tax=Capsaspora owczarzaki (strain ATCC 30864) TaxID=595528 RepID=A0A0D2VP69_CAPO3|nr:leucine Rich Repeat family protein [Capsaspora owczarzaki ATCC 30864]KJE92202.1 leucine Rich Repeat family protein [Capsaspora owczarzaki ATCC 30864]|eukprot:XP_004364054.1 leucine Rich Repeat family protein [Capsaspora owczarzaki ATCC 30864]